MKRFTPSSPVHWLICIALLTLCSCAGTKTNQLWTEVYPDYIAVYVRDAPKEMQELREQKVMHGTDWYWSDDGRWLFVKRPIAERCMGYTGKSLGTPIAMAWDGVIIVAKTLDGSMSQSQGDFLNGLASLTAFMSGKAR